MHFGYRDDQIAVRDAVRDFARARIVPNAEKWSEDGKFPLDLLPELAQLGLTGLAAFLWSLRAGQYEDIEGAALRVLSDEDLERKA